MKRSFALFTAFLLMVAFWGCGPSKAEREAAEARSQYIENLKLARTEMIRGAAESESVCNLTKSVWRNTIYEKEDPETDAYTISSEAHESAWRNYAAKITGKANFHSDFNVSIEKLYASEDIMASVATIEASQNVVDELMKQLINPTEEFRYCYEDLRALSDVYYDFTSLAISPSGNLQSYSEKSSSLSSDFMKYYDKLGREIPEE